MHHSRLSSRTIPGQAASCLDCPSNSVSHLLSFSPLDAVPGLASVFALHGGFECLLGFLLSRFPDPR